MSSIINASVSSNGIVSTADASGILLCQSNGVNTNAQAWVTYKGTSTQSIRASYNVSSVTYIGTGNYQINFTNAMTDTNYCTVGMGGTSGSIGYSVLSNYSSNFTPTTSAFQVREYSPGLPGNADADYISIAVFR
jgi:hypothetical protein